MNFYKQVIIVAIVILIISLSIIGTVLATSSNDVSFPPTINACPDFYNVNSDGHCEALKDVYDASKQDCEIIDFTDDTKNYLNPGTGPDSGACAKKQKSNECGITWDGITNNPDICYVSNKTV